MVNDTHETICLILMVASPILSLILLFNQLKFNKNATQKKKQRTQKTLLHRKQGWNQTLNENQTTKQ